MMTDLSMKNIFQWAFAISPFPSYLPQYFAIMQRLHALDSPDSNDNGNSSSLTNVSIDRGSDYYLRKRLQTFSARGSVSNSCDAGGLASTMASNHATISPGAGGFLVPGTPSKPQSEMIMHGVDDKEKLEEDVGLSPATVFILLAAHLIRMLYFHGLLLEEQHHTIHHLENSFARPRASAGNELDRMNTITTDGKPIRFEDETNLIQLLSSKPTAVSRMVSSIPERPTIQWDLFGQSCCMIIVQVMLLHAMISLRRKQNVRRKKKAASSELSDMNYRPPPFSVNNSATNGAQQILHNLSPQPFLQRQCERVALGIKSHFLHLISPSNIMKHHSFLQYMELLFFSSMAIKIVFDYHWYPRYRMGIVEGLKHASVALESCLAVPQAIRNHSMGTTEGLSLVMVAGWVAGDFFKLCYFLLGMISAPDSVQTVEHEGNNVFALGCLLALMVDLFVAMQMLCWYPTSDVLQLRESITQSIRHWKANKDDDAGKSLLMKSPEYRKAGLFASAVHAFYALFRKRPSSTSSQSLDS
ncbi:hypothetical protein HJC23_011590 [Cyclotella cryptica]|uniref:Uncharacterized protein n=1 Tax=Cyclotella cryptica TaxID=29204 RepID=A0ABD3QRV6_9STRA|eukprot:CCRYP_002716-RA/>CCRYP_002716-RA protein AED:0.00 eAED:0.00 QI:300/-1/1/1/-1/1/1/66/527